MSDVEIDPVDRVYDTVIEALENGAHQSDIEMRVRDAVREWQIQKREARAKST